MGRDDEAPSRPGLMSRPRSAPSSWGFCPAAELHASQVWTQPSTPALVGLPGNPELGPLCPACAGSAEPDGALPLCRADSLPLLWKPPQFTKPAGRCRADGDSKAQEGGTGLSRLHPGTSGGCGGGERGKEMATRGTGRGWPLSARGQVGRTTPRGVLGWKSEPPAPSPALHRGSAAFQDRIGARLSAALLTPMTPTEGRSGDSQGHAAGHRDPDPRAWLFLWQCRAQVTWRVAQQCHLWGGRAEPGSGHQGPCNPQEVKDFWTDQPPVLSIWPLPRH